MECIIRLDTIPTMDLTTTTAIKIEAPDLHVLTVQVHQTQPQRRLEANPSKLLSALLTGFCSENDLIQVDGATERW